MFGTGLTGTVLFDIVQAVTALILYTGANTSFNGFPFLASFVAGDSFLPRQLTKRGHRLVFSNGIIVLAVTAIALLVVSGGTVSALVPFYAIGVFTGFTMAGFGMSRHHLTRREAGWRRKLVINATAGALSLLVVLTFAVVKSTEGAWAVVVLFPILVFALIRLNRQYHEEEAALAALAPILDAEPTSSRHIVLVFVDTLDLATLRALRYARGLRPTKVRAVHFVLDEPRARRLAQRWNQFQRGDIGLELRDCPDRRLGRGSVELISEQVADGRTEVTVLLPRRTYSPVLGRLLHDRTADHIAERISGVRHATATTIPFDVSGPVRRLSRAHQEGETFLDTQRRLTAAQQPAPTPAAAVPHVTSTAPAPTPIGELGDRGTATIIGRVDTISVTSSDGTLTLICTISDDTGAITARFHSRS